MANSFHSLPFLTYRTFFIVPVSLFPPFFIIFDPFFNPLIMEQFSKLKITILILNGICLIGTIVWCIIECFNSFPIEPIIVGIISFSVFKKYKSQFYINTLIKKGYNYTLTWIRKKIASKDIVDMKVVSC